MTARRPVIALLALAAVAAAPAAGAAAKVRTFTLRDKSGLTVKAPRGYKLRNSGGVYTVSNRRATLVLLRLRSSASALATGRELARALTGTAAGSGTATRFSARVKVAGRTQALGVRRAGSALIVSTIRDARKGGAHATAPRARAALTAADIATLQRVAGTATGGQAANLSPTLPTTQFVAPDGGSRAQVPAGGDWQYKGGGGQIIASSASLGAAISLGLPFGVTLPGGFGTPYPYYPVAAYSPDPVRAAQQIIPDYLNRNGGKVTSLRVVADLAPGLAPTGLATGVGYYAFSMVAGGIPGQGVMYVSVSDQGSESGFWTVYFSFIVVKQGSDPRIFATLLKTWQSWDPSADQQRRIADTYRTLASIRYNGAGPIDDQVFSEAAAKWDLYIRGPEE